ncbi:MAG: hypothetical protein ABI634_14000 [Acidobacteriota bacterium]
MADDVTLRIGADAQAAIDNLEKVQKSLAGIVDRVQKASPIYDQFGQVVTSATDKAAKGTDKAEKSTSLLDTSWAKLTGAFTASSLIDRAVGSLVGLAEGAFGAASHILDLHTVTGLSTETLQRFAYVEARTGTQTDALSSAAYKLALNLSGGGDSVSQAVSDLGLNYERLRASSPESQFLTVINRLAAMGDEHQRNNLAVALLGKTWREVAPAAVAGIQEIGEAAIVSTDQQLESIARQKEAYDGFWKGIEQGTVKTIGTLAILWEEASEGARLTNADNLHKQQEAEAQAMIALAAKLQGAVAEALRPKTGLPLPVPHDYLAQLEEVRRAYSKLTDAQKEQIRAGLELGDSTEKIMKETGVAVPVIERYKEALQEQKQAQDDATRKDEERRNALRELHSSLSDLNATQIDQIASLLRAGKSEGDIAKAYGYTATQIRAVKDQEKQRADALADQIKIVTDAAAEQQKASEAAMEDGKTKTKAYADYIQDLDDRLAVARADRSDKEFAQAEIDYRKEVELARERAGTDDAAYEAELERINGIYEKKTLELLSHNKMLADGNKGAAKVVKESWEDALGHVADLMDQVGDAAGGGFGEVLHGAGQAIDIVRQLGTAIEAVKNKSTSMATAVSGAMAVLSATHFAAQIISDMEDPGWLNRMTEIGSRWGVSISRSLAEQLADPVAQSDIARAIQNTPGLEFKIDLNRLDLRVAITDLLNLDKIMQDVGVDAENVNDWIDRAGPLFDVVANGGEAGAMATKTLVSVIDQVGQQVQKTGGLWSQSFKDMIAKAQDLGVGVESIRTLIAGQLDIVTSSTQGIVGGLTAEIEQSFQKTTDAAFKLIDDTYGKSAQGDEARAAMTEKANADIVANYQGEFDRVSNITLASFNAYIAQGHTAVEASRAFGDSIDALTAEAEKFGFAGGAAYNELAQWRSLVANNEPLLTQVGSLNALMTALDNVNGLTASSFADLQTQGETAYQRLLDAGFTEQQALGQMKPLLETIRRLHEDKNYAVDEGTQKLLDQAEASGVLGEAEESTQRVLKDGLSALITTLGGDIPEAWRKSAQAAKDAAADIHANATAKIQGGLDTVEGQLSDGRVWEEWAENGRAAARRVSDEVDHLNFGHSPGGLKEIPLLLGKSEKAAGDWSNDLLDQLAVAQRAVDGFQAPGAPAGGDGAFAAAAFTGAAAAGDGWMGPRELHVHMPMPDGTERVEVIDLVNTGLAQGRIQVPARAVTSEVWRG